MTSVSSNENKKPGDRIVSFGKHAGKKYSELPTEYLLWFTNNAYSQMVDRQRWAVEELNRRKGNL